MTEKWRELTSIEDFEFDPDGKYDGALYKEQWDEIFNELLQRAETTEEYLDNDWIEPVSTRNAYTYKVKKGGENYIILKYYDGMYALYEIKENPEESVGVYGKIFIESYSKYFDIRAAINETKKIVTEDVAGMEKEECDKLENLLKDWIGNNLEWKYKIIKTNNVYTIHLLKNPIHKFDEPVAIELDNNILNGEIYFEGLDSYLSSTGPVSLSGLKSILRDLVSQLEIAEDEMTEESGDIYNL